MKQLFKELYSGFKKYPTASVFLILTLYIKFYHHQISNYLDQEKIEIEFNDIGWCLVVDECISDQNIRGTYTECDEVEISDTFETYQEAYREKKKLLDIQNKKLTSYDYLNLRLLGKTTVGLLYLPLLVLSIYFFFKKDRALKLKKESNTEE